MVKGALYFLVVFMLITSIIILVLSINKAIKKKLNIINIAFLIITIVNYLLLANKIVDTGWNMIFISIVTLVTIILQIVSLIIANIKKQNKEGNIPIIISIVVVIVPVLILIIPIAYETYLLNSCTYLLEYNYQSGIISSKDSYVAIINEKPYEISLKRNILRKEATYETKSYLDFDYYTIKFNDSDNFEIEKYENGVDYSEKINAIGESIKNTYPSVESVDINYLSQDNSAIVFIESDDNMYGKEYYYHNGQFTEINVVGNLESIKYYK